MPTVFNGDNLHKIFVADNILISFFFSEKISLDISCDSSARQMFHMKCEDLFFFEKKKIKMLSAAVVIGAKG